MKKLVSIFGAIVLGASFSLVLTAHFKNEPKRVDAEITTRAEVEAEWLEWTSTTSLPTSGYYYLGNNVTITSNNITLSDTVLHLDLNGNTVSFEYEGDDSDNAITLTTYSEFSLYDSTGTGVIERKNTANYERFIYLDRSTVIFNLNGGTIRNFKNSNEDSYGGAVHIYSGTFNMNGGVITDCEAAYGGAVYVGEYAGQANLSGGEIFNNTSTIGNGGAILILSGTVRVSGSTYIHDNYAKRAGGAFYCGFSQETGSRPTLSFDGGVLGDNISELGCTIIDKDSDHSVHINLLSGRFLTASHPNIYYCESDRLVKSLSNITFDKNGGTGGTDSLSSVAWNSNLSNIDVPTFVGHTFLGYFDQYGVKYFDELGRPAHKEISSATWDYVGNQTLYAEWSANKYTVTLDSQGGSGGSTSVLATYGSDMPEITVPEKDDYNFLGYFDATTDGNKYYNNDGTSASGWNKTSNTTLYAQWETKHVHSLKTSYSQMDPTCSDDGYKAHYQCECGLYFEDNLCTSLIGDDTALASWKQSSEGGKIDALGHDYQFVEFVWDEFTAQAKYECSRDSSHIDLHDATITSEVTIEPTCTTTGIRTYTASYDGHTDTKTETIPVKGHNYQFVEFVWDEYTAQAKYVCSHDSTHIELHDATVTSEITTQPTCTTSGIRTYTASYDGHIDTKTEIIPALGHSLSLVSGTPATCEDSGFKDAYYCETCEKYFEDEKASKEIENYETWKTSGDGLIDALGHDYRFVEFVWDEFTAQAKYECSRDSSHVDLHDATITSEVTIEPTCTTTGIRTYTASYDGHTDTKTEIIPVKGHNYQFAEFVWNGFNAKAKYVCDNDTLHIEFYDTVVTSEVTVEPTCTTTGIRTYTASHDGHTDNKTEIIPALGHSLNLVSGTPATCEDSGFKDAYYCETCEKYFEDEKASKAIEDYETWKTSGDGFIDALGHDYQFVEFVWDEFTAQAKYVCSHDSTHIELYDAVITSEVTTEPTCLDNGIRTYTASYDGHSDTKEETIDPIGHDYKFVEFVWNEFNAKAKYVCDNDTSHIELHDAVVTSEVTVEPTCTTTGIRTYTASYDGHTDNKTEIIPVICHSMSKISGQNPTCETNGYKDAYYCESCKQYFEDIEGTKLIENYEIWKTSGGGVIYSSHDIVLVEGKEPTTTEDGYKSCYVCNKCNLYFEDQTCTKLIGNKEAYDLWILNGGKLDKLPSKGLSGGAIAGMAGGSVVAVGAISYAIYYFIIKKKH